MAAPWKALGDERTVHVYPRSLDVEDIDHEDTTGTAVMHLQASGCALCAVGQCTQFIRPREPFSGDVIVHGRLLQ